MPRSRILLSFFVALLAVTLIGAIGWCGGPVEPRQARPDRAPQMGNMGDQASAGAGDAGFSSSGGVGSGSASGTSGKSPYADLQKDFLLQGAPVYQIRASAMVPGISGLRVVGDYTYADYHGGGTRPSGPNITPVTWAFPGDTFTSQLTTSSISVSLDYLAAGFGTGAFKIGPRVQYANYTDVIRVDNATTPALSAALAHTSGSMIGFGLVGTVDFGKLTGLYSGYLGSPELNVTAQYGGGGSSMRYFNWEVALKVAKTSLYNYGQMPVSVSAEVAYQSYHYKGTVDDNTDGTIQYTTGWGLDRSSRADVTYSVPMVRGVLSF